MNRITPIHAEEPAKTRLRGIGVRQVRLACGIVLFAYLISHFVNHALGNISLDALGIGIWYHSEFWQMWPSVIALYGALAIHGGLGIWALYQRRHFHWKGTELLQLLLGLSIPALAVGHVVGARLSYALFWHEKFYPQVLYGMWSAPGTRLLLITTAMIVAWVHGCIGLHFWLRMKPFYRRAAPWLLAAAVLLPTVAWLGIYQGGRQVMIESANPQWRQSNLTEHHIGTPAEQRTLDDIITYALLFYLGLLAAALAARGVRALLERRAGMVTLSYGNGRTIRVSKGLSVLEASLRHNVPHASVCGGRARCSTCRIRVIGDHGELPAPSPREAFVLSRVGTADPSVRLACQLRPNSDLSFFQLFMPHTDLAGASAQASGIGQERYLVSLFVDMRGSTRLAEKRLPFDTVFIVNRFLSAVSQAVLDNGGQPNQFIGDGMLALFGLKVGPQSACRQAIRAAAAIARNIEELNSFLSHDLREPIRFGIGVHGGEVIVGDIGYRDHMVFTALGDAVNVAARLQDMTKTLGCEAILSDEVHSRAGLADSDLPQQEIAIRGRAEPMIARVAVKAAELAALADKRTPA